MTPDQQKEPFWHILTMAKNILDTAYIPDVDPNFQPGFNEDWPTNFPKPVVGIEKKHIVTKDETGIQCVPEVLQAIKQLRLKGYKFVMLNDEANKTPNEVDWQNQLLMDEFGKAGIQSITTLYYSIGMRNTGDHFVKPGTGMFKRCEQEHPYVKFKEGWYVGTTISDIKAGFKVGARPILINVFPEEVKKLNSFSNQKLKKKTKVFDSFVDFANTLK